MGLRLMAFGYFTLVPYIRKQIKKKGTAER